MGALARSTALGAMLDFEQSYIDRKSRGILPSDNVMNHSTSLDLQVCLDISNVPIDTWT